MKNMVKAADKYDAFLLILRLAVMLPWGIMSIYEFLAGNPFAGFLLMVGEVLVSSVAPKSRKYNHGKEGRD